MLNLEVDNIYIGISGMGEGEEEREKLEESGSYTKKGT